MKRLTILVAPALLLLAVALLVRQGVTERSSEEGANARGKTSKSERSPHAADSAGAARRLGRLLGEGKKPDTSFAAIEAAARKLSDEELHALIEEVWPLGVEGYAGWVRCALFAEWGRRDPEGALAYLADPPLLPEPMRNWSWSNEERQHLFSVFRGWGEIDPEAALARLSTQVDVITAWHERS